MITETENPRLPSFTKMTGTGNDFLILDARRDDFPKLNRSEFVKQICRRSFSIGADGVVFLEKPSSLSAAFKWDFYNSDGSPAEMCGNASRCVAKYAVKNKITKSPVVFETKMGLVEARIRSNNLDVEVDFPGPKIVEKEVVVPVGEHIKINVAVINSGVPHAVRENDDWDDEYLNDMGGFLRRHPLFQKYGGANATFYQVIEGSNIQSATFERGVEAITLACGTGAVAAATAAVMAGVKSPVTVHVPGGKLVVLIAPHFEKATLVGEARFICEGNISPEALL